MNYKLDRRAMNKFSKLLKRFLLFVLSSIFIFSFLTISFAADFDGSSAKAAVSKEEAAEKDAVEKTVKNGEKISFPETFKNKIKNFIIKFRNDFHQCFIKDKRYRHITNGLLETLKLTFVALAIGLIIGFFVSVICAANDKNGTMKLWAKLCRLYLSVFRGTPVIVQLLIIYYLWLGKLHVGETYVAMVAFGLNSGAYVAEIMRSGIMSIDNGQFEAGRSLGFNYPRTMLHIILPQAFKNVLPALANEFITLLKETSVASFIAVKDMMKGANVIVGVTYNMYMPYLTVALIYLVLVIILTKLVSLLERRLRSSEH